MVLLQTLSTLALRPLAPLGADLFGRLVASRFTDHSQDLPRALAVAVDRAWGAVEVALLGDSLPERWRTWLAPAEVRAFRREVAALLAERGEPDVRRVCLRQLREARRAGLLPDTGHGAEALVRRAGTLAGFTGPKALLRAAWEALAETGPALRAAGHDDLADLLATPVPGGDSLLVLAVRYFFRRAVAAHEALHRELAWAGGEELLAPPEPTIPPEPAAPAESPAPRPAPGPSPAEELRELERVLVALEEVLARLERQTLGITAEVTRRLEEELDREPDAVPARLCRLAPQVPGPLMTEYGERTRQCRALRRRLGALRRDHLHAFLLPWFARVGETLRFPEADWVRLGPALRQRFPGWPAGARRRCAGEVFRAWQTRREEEDWAEAQAAGTAGAFGRYLASWPGGRHAALAAAKLAPEADEEAWRQALARDTPEAYAEYLRLCPEGRHARRARARSVRRRWWAIGGRG
jgi:hypothetical protein